MERIGSKRKDTNRIGRHRIGYHKIGLDWMGLDRTDRTDKIGWIGKDSIGFDRILDRIE